MPHLPLQIGLHYLWWLLGYQSRTQFISPHPCSYYTTAFDSWWEIGGGSIHRTQEKKKYRCPCSQKAPTNTHTHLKLLERSKRLITGMRLWDEEGEGRRMEGKWGGAKVDLCAAWSHPVVTMGHPLLRWQWEWQAYLRGRRRAVTDWTDRAVGGCVEMTGCISIWVKNLANVANVAVGEEERGYTGWLGPSWLVSLLFSLSLRPICLFASIFSVCWFVCATACPFVSLCAAVRHTHMKAWPNVKEKYFHWFKRMFI